MVLSLSNATPVKVYSGVMRGIAPWVLLLGMRSIAQPGEGVSVLFVHQANGSPMPGAYAQPITAQDRLGKPDASAWTVQMHFTVSDDYPYAPHEIGTRKQWTLSADTVRDGRQRHLRFHMFDCWCRDQYLLVIQAGDTMRVDLTNDGNTRGQLVHERVTRSGLVPPPKVIRFRPGRFSFEAMAQDGSLHELEQRIARSVMYDVRKREAAFASSSGRIGGPHEALQVRERPSLVRDVKLVGWRGDTAVLRVTGAVMLDGGCASNTPMMAIQVNVTHDNWLQLASTVDVQMDCGRSTAEWKDHELRIPVVEWMQRHGPQGLAVLPGRYRLGLRFADSAVRWTNPFTLE